jgi:hypothetical protein
MVHPYASRHEGPGFNPQGDNYVKTGILLLALSRYTVKIWTQIRRGIQIQELTSRYVPLCGIKSFRAAMCPLLAVDFIMRRRTVGDSAARCLLLEELSAALEIQLYLL